MNYHENLGNFKNNKLLGLGTKILSSGVFLPKQSVTSVDIFDAFHSEKNYGIEKTWMVDKMGIIERRVSDTRCSPSELAISAAEQAIANYDGRIDEIDAVIFCGIERDQPEPATAHEIQKKLGLSAGFAFDIGNACFGFFDAIRVASSLIESKSARSALIVTGEVMSRVTEELVEQLKKGIPVKDAYNKMGFISCGDAGAAMIIGESGDGGYSGFTSFDLKTISNCNDLCYFDNTKGELEAQMKMAKIVAKTWNLQKEILTEAQKRKNWEAPKYLLTHQVGKKAFEQVADFGLVPQERMIKSYDYFGNVTSATLGLNYHQLITSHKLKQGEVVRACYSGSGIVAGQLSMRI